MNRPGKRECPAQPIPVYEFRVRGLLPESWSEWFEGFEVVPQQEGESLLVGPAADQAALHGVLVKIRDLNLVLLSVNSHAPEHD